MTTTLRHALHRLPAVVLLWLVVGVVILAGAPAAQAEDRIWSGIVIASQADKPKPAPPELAKVADKIERFFGYNQLELVGAATKVFDDESEQWLVPTQNFWLSAKARKGKENEYLLKVALFHDKHTLVETEARLGLNSPLLIRGPMHARGQIVIVLQVLR